MTFYIVGVCGLRSLVRSLVYPLIVIVFLKEKIPSAEDNVKYQLHGFLDASNNALSCVVCLRCVVNGKVAVSFVFGKSRVV